jgi:type VI secretion system protein ImpJ
LGERLRDDRRLNWAYPYGIVEARLSADALENMLVRFDRLRAIMPSGLEVNFPEDAEMPALNIKQAFQAAGGADGIDVLLGVPLWYDARANSAEPGPNSDPRAKLLYRVAEIQAADENTGENPQPMLVRRVNARLLLETDDRSDLEVIPLMRIIPAVGESVGLPRQDPQFAPPCFVLNGSTPLRELARDLASQVEASRRELVLQTTRGGFDWNNLRGLQLEQLWRLRTLNRFAARLPSMVEAPAVAPFTIYLELRALLGELSALQPDRDDFDAPPYDHDAPFLPFYELAAKIRGYLRGTVAPSFTKVPFVDVGGLLTAEFTDEHFTLPTEYFLGIQTREDPRRLAQLVEDADRFKLMPRSMAARAIRGVQLKEERFPPLELPAQAGLYYYRLQRAESARAWQQIATEKSAIVRWSGADIPGGTAGASADYQVTLFMILPASA